MSGNSERAKKITTMEAVALLRNNGVRAEARDSEVVVIELLRENDIWKVYLVRGYFGTFDLTVPNRFPILIIGDIYRVRYVYVIDRRTGFFTGFGVE